MIYRIKLHDEIAAILRDNGNRWMSWGEIASQVNERDRYVRLGGVELEDASMTSRQISARVNKYPNLFERDGGRIPHRVRLLKAQEP